MIFDYFLFVESFPIRMRWITTAVALPNFGSFIQINKQKPLYRFGGLFPNFRRLCCSNGETNRNEKQNQNNIFQIKHSESLKSKISYFCGKDCYDSYSGSINLIITENMIKAISSFEPYNQTWFSVMDNQAAVSFKIHVNGFLQNEIKSISEETEIL